MKANEAPEKIILSADIDTQIIHDEWVINDYTDNIKIEYTRTDTIIEKACDYLMEYEFNDSPTIADRRKRVDEFRKYMEGGIKL